MLRTTPSLPVLAKAPLLLDHILTACTWILSAHKVYQLCCFRHDGIISQSNLPLHSRLRTCEDAATKRFLPYR